jgi:hypothetical protein
LRVLLAPHRTRQHAPPAVENVVLLVRGPRVVAAVLVGAAPHRRHGVPGPVPIHWFRPTSSAPPRGGAGRRHRHLFSLGVIGIESLPSPAG